jgi:2-keto-4-pentenoate hydratase
VSRPWDDPRIRKGTEAQFAALRARRAAGEKSIGWKVAFSAPAIMQQLGISAPLVGFLTDRARVENGATVSLAGWKKPVFEPEIAVHMGADLSAGGDLEAARQAIAGIGPAIELVDLERPPQPDALEAIIGGNIFQRHVVVGPVDRSRAGAKVDGLAGRIFRRDAKVAETTQVTANTGDPVALARHVADLLGAFGERLSAGHFIITGSVVPPLFLDPADDSARYELDPIGALSLRFAYG